MNFKEKQVIINQKQKDGGGKTTRCPKHKTKMQLVSIKGGRAYFACKQCNPDAFK